MGRLIKVLVVLAVLGFIGLTGYAYLADLSPTASEVKLPVTLNVDKPAWPMFGGGIGACAANQRFG